MKLKKHIFTILLVVLLFLLISSVSATDINTNDTQTVSASGNDEILSVGNDVDILGAGEYNYTYLRQQINSGGDITLIKGNYTYADGDGDTIKITKSGVIDGNGAVIDMAGLGRAFYVTESGVTIKNLTIKNAKYNGDGGAIFFSSSGTVENCNFTKNSASSWGGAVYFDEQGTVTNCNFTANQASRGGAVFFLGEGTVTNCNFTANQASRGGAVYFYNHGDVTNCNFTDNQASRDGGAVFFVNNGNVTNCNFTGNNATTGSAIYFYKYYSTDTLTISNSTFLNNRANAEALEVIKNENNITITFTGNDNLINAIYSRNDAEVTFTNVTYWSAKGINNTGSSAIKPSRSNKEAGQNITVEIYDSNGQSVDNVTLVTDENGQVTYSLLNNENCLCKAYHIEDCYYTYVEYKDLGDFNRLQKYINEAEEYSTLTLYRNYTFTPGFDDNLKDGIVIDKKLTINGNGYTIDALQKARIFNVNSDNVVLNNITFINAITSGSGGAIYFSSSGTVENCNFTANQASREGGAIYFSKDGGVTNCNFTGNKATGSNSWGGAIYMSSGSVENCNFINNTATNGNGGAIRMYSGSVTNCNFTANQASRGGAVFFWDEGTVTNCNFTDNTATNGDGGAIRMSSGSVTNCNFTGNKATGSNSWGGAIYMSSGSVENCNFTNNTATNGNGGAVYFYSNGNVTNCNFTANQASVDGGAVYFDEQGTVTNCNFTGNNATTGSAIYFYKYYSTDTLTISNSTFLNNRANAEALEVTKNENNITITFTGNDNLLNAIYSRNDAEVTFTNVTYWSAKGINNTGSSAIKPSRSNKEAGQNITVSVIVNDKIVLNEVKVTDENGMVVLDNINVGENYFIGVRHDTDSYYTEKVNTTSNNTNFNVNVTSQTTNNKTVNITAKSNIPNEVIKGKLLFILPNSTEINATYASNGTWWALHTFDDAGDYNINATYIGLDNVTINNGTISIRYDARVDVNNNTLNLLVGDNFTIVATTVPEGVNVTFVQDDSGVYIVDENGVVTALKNGTGSVLVKIGGDGVYAENSTIVNVTVSKVPTEIKVTNTTLDLKVDGEIETGATLIPADAGNLTYTVSNPSIVKVEEGKIIALKEGNATITVSFTGNKKYLPAENKTINVTVQKVNTNMDISAGEITEGENATISVTLPSDATGNVSTTVNGKTYSSEVKDGKAVITVPDLLKGDYTLPITYSGDDKYNPLTKDVNITVEGGKAIISAPDLVKYYSGSERFVVNLTYAKGSPAANTPVNITINGVTYTRTTDENGIASLNINLGAGKYDVTVKTDDGTADSVVTVLSTINASDVESKTKNLVFTAAFIDGTGNPLTDGTLVTFNVKGVIYNSTVKGGKGSASIDLTMDSGRYIITSFNPVSGENASNNIAVDLKDAEMILSGDEITVGENATISVTLLDDATGNVTASVNGKSYSSKVNEGKANIIIPGLSAGNHTIPVTYSGDDKYNSASGETNVTVNKANATITIDAPAITVGENATVTVTLPSDATGSVSIGNESVPVKDGTASAVLTDLPVGTNTIPVTYSGDDKYNSIETSADIIVNEKPVPAKENLTIKATADEITEGENATVIITGLENATGNVSANINGKTYTAPINKGQSTITVPGLAENATAAINYPGDDKYNPAVTTVNITVNKNTVTITAENLTKYYRDSEKFTVKVTDAKGDAASNKTAEITINGVTYKRTTDENGTAKLNINLGAGEYPVSVAVDDVVVNSTVIVKSTIDASDVVKMFRNDTQYYARFTDSNNIALANTKVSFNINGIIYNRTTDANGTAKLNINMAAGDYIITATNPVTGEMKSNTIKVISLIESDDLTKYYRNASQFVVRIHSADGGYAGAGEEVKFNVNGVFYTRTTNATGHAKLNINLEQGNYTITTYHKDCSQGNEITVLPILSADDLVMKYRDGSQFKAKLVDGQGKAYAGQSVQFNINGLLYNRVTGSDGIAKLNINLMSGEYIITSSYNGFNIANKITIRG